MLLANNPSRSKYRNPSDPTESIAPFVPAHVAKKECVEVRLKIYVIAPMQFVGVSVEAGFRYRHIDC